VSNLTEWLERLGRQGFFRLLRLLPTDVSSALGSKVVRANVVANRPEILNGARRNLARHRPDWSAGEIDAAVSDFLDGVGRFMTEFAVMDRLIPEGRLDARGTEAFAWIAGREPIIAFGLHTGNWETFGPQFRAMGIPLASFYAPPEDPFERRIAEECRAHFGVQLLAPDARGARDGLRLLKQNRVVMIFPDETREGRCMAPLFGRAPHDKGNLAIAARLARMSGARFVICHSERTEGARFVLNISEPFALPATSGQPDVLADVAFLNGQIEPVILKNIPRWYFLDDSLEEIG
jgi:Kdo2-lipid IVA lauroyltransferase/acyltransferase